MVVLCQFRIYAKLEMIYTTELTMNMQNSTSSEEYSQRKEPEVRSFYSGARRGELVDQILQSIQSLTPFITLSGEEGIGKSVVIETVTARAPQHFVVAVMPIGVQSFDEILQIIAHELGITLPEQKGKKVLGSVIDTIRKHLEDGGLKLLVVFDSAELLYLATLERTRKTFDRINENSVMVMLLLAGRPALTEHLRQLSMCNFGSEGEEHFSLPSMSVEETVEYLNFRYKQNTDAEPATSFSYGAGGNIYAVAGGNFRMTNVIAKQILGRFSEARPARIEADDVSEFAVEQKHEKLSPAKRWLTRKNMMIAGGVVLGLLVLWLLLPGGKEDTKIAVKQHESDQPQIKNPQKPKDVAVKSEIPAEERSGDAKNPLEEAKAELAAIEKSAKAEKEAAKAKAETKRDKEEKIAEKEAPAVSVQEGNKTAAGGDVQDLNLAPAEKAAEKTVVSEKKKAVEESVSKADKVKEEAVPVIKTDKNTEKPLKNEPEKAVAAEPAKNDPQITKTSTQVEPVRVNGVDSPAHKDKFNERLVAGVGWLYGGADDKFTVQLMVLTSDNAEENLRKMLLEDGYKDIADDIYILKKSGAETPLLVFYGEYPTMSEARNARNTLPQILRKHHPYPISIAGAVEKAK